MYVVVTGADRQKNFSNGGNRLDYMLRGPIGPISAMYEKLHRFVRVVFHNADEQITSGLWT